MARIWIAFYLCGLGFIGCSGASSAEPAEPNSSATPVTSIDGDRGPPGGIHNLPRGCYVMKRRDADEYGCFGCVGELCHDEDRAQWDYVDQGEAEQLGHRCVARATGCEMVH